MDSTARLAARLARVAGGFHPKDWVQAYESHTPYEWVHQLALSIVDPWGDDRADLRAEVNSLAQIAPSEDSVERLRCYLKIHEQQEEAGPAQMRLLLGE